MVFKDSIQKHHCDFPLEVTRDHIGKFWECDECGAQYSVRFKSDWDGFWDADTLGEVVQGVTKYGNPALYAMDEKYHVCPPYVEFYLLHKGNLYAEYYSISINIEEEMPQYFKEMDGKTRPLWRDQPLPKGAAVEAEEGYNLARVAHPGDDDLGLAPELKKKPKKKWWLQ